MKHKKKLLLATFVVVLGLLMASPALAALKGADWQMNETSGRMIDSSGNNNDGDPTDIVQTGSVYRFNGSTSRVVVPDDDSLNPESEDITLTARVKVDNEAMDDDSYDVVRKGLTTTPGGDYKMEIKRQSDPTVGNLHCLFKGSGGRVSRTVRTDLVDGNWHTLECIKTRNSVVARVDEGKSYTRSGSAGWISNSAEVLVGAKVTDPFDDMFDGSMYSVNIDIADNASQEPSPDDNTDPTVIETRPADGARCFDRDHTLSVVFSEDMDPSTINETNFTLYTLYKGAVDSANEVPAAVRYNAERDRAILNPSVRLTSQTNCAAVVDGGANGVEDEAGNPMRGDYYTFTFKTGRG